jgi:hypothetical protein
MKSNELPGKLNRRSVLTYLATAYCLPRGLALAQAKGPLPKGFSQFKGPIDDFFESTVDGQRVISIRSQASGGIVRHPVDFPLEPGLRLRWDWRVNTLPSTVAETTAATHDYSSIAVEFDDGRDLTWYWSAALKEGEHFVCPLPGWSTETHYVVGTGSAGRGRWVLEDREIAADAQVALKQTPSKVVAVWLIVYTVPQKRLASTDFRSISFVNRKGEERVIFPA